MSDYEMSDFEISDSEATPESSFVFSVITASDLTNAIISKFDLTQNHTITKEIPDSGGYKITKSGDVYRHGGHAKISRTVSVRRSCPTNYDKLLQTLQPQFKDNDDWIDIPQTDKELHRTGLIRNKNNGGLLNVNAKLGRTGKIHSVYVMIEQLHFKPEDRIFNDNYETLKKTFPQLTFEKMWELCPMERHFLLCIQNLDRFFDYADALTEVGDLKSNSKTQERHWKCRFHGNEYLASPLMGNRCSTCQENCKTISNPTAKLDTGNAIERAVYKLLISDSRTSNSWADFRVSNAKDDQVIRLLADNTHRCIQIKTLIKIKINTKFMSSIYLQGILRTCL